MEQIKTGKKLNGIVSFDLIKGIMMIAIIFMHSFNDHIKYWEIDYAANPIAYILAPLKMGIYAFVPMFFMLSGYGFVPTANKKRIKKKIFYILKAYVIVAVIICALSVLKKIICSESIIEAVKFRVVPFVLGICPGDREFAGFYIDSIGPVWFLLSLMLAWLILNFIMNIKTEWIKPFLMVACVAFGMELGRRFLIPFCITQSLVATGYMYAGWYLKNNEVLERPQGKLNMAILILIFIIIVIFGNVDVSQNVWELGAIDVIGTFIGGFLVLKASVYIEDVRLKVVKPIRIVGRYSFFVLCVHTVEYTLIPWQDIIHKVTYNRILGVIMEFILRGIVVFTGCFLVNRITRFIRSHSR